MLAKLGRIVTNMIVGALVCACALTSLPACANGGPQADKTAQIEAAKAVTVHVAVYKGVGSMGLLSFADKASQGKMHNDFQCVTSASLGEIAEGLKNAEVDIAVAPCEIATRIYAEGTGVIKVAGVTSVDGLRVVTASKVIKSFDDLSGRTVLLTGGGTMTEYVVRTLLAEKGMTDSVTLQFMGSALDVAAMLSSDRTAVAILAEPYATAATQRDERLRHAVNLSDTWAETFGEGSQFVGNVVLVRNAFAQAHPEAVEEFLEGQAVSATAFRDDPDGIAQMATDAGLVDDVTVAAAVIPNCAMVSLTGEEMVETVSGYLEAIFGCNPGWVGGSLPADDFYYLPAED